MTLYEMMLNTYNNQYWNYYRNPFISNPIESPNESLSFIEEYFQAGQKGFVINPFIDSSDYLHSAYSLTSFRSTHTISTFFIGLSLCKWIYGENLSIENNYPFSYFWFLACLYHDYGYIVESNKNVFPVIRTHINHNIDLEYYKANAILKKKLKISCTIYSSIRHGQQYHDDNILIEMIYASLRQNQRHVQFNNGIIKSGYSNSSLLLAKYFSLFVNDENNSFYNHGIIGGQIFFDKMIKNYLQAYHKACLARPVNFGDFYFKDKHFCLDQFRIFTYITDSIMAHNVWVANDDNRESYIEYGLNELLPENFKKISQRNPLLYILSIADNIEPYKVYSNESETIDPHYIWNIIDFDYNRENHILTITILESAVDIAKLWERLKSLSTWINASAELNENKIHLKLEE